MCIERNEARLDSNECLSLDLSVDRLITSDHLWVGASCGQWLIGVSAHNFQSNPSPSFAEPDILGCPAGIVPKPKFLCNKVQSLSLSLSLA